MDPTLYYNILVRPEESSEPYFWLVRMKESYAQKLETFLDKKVDDGVIYDAEITEAGELIEGKDFMEALKEVPGFEQDWMP